MPTKTTSKTTTKRTSAKSVNTKAVAEKMAIAIDGAKTAAEREGLKQQRRTAATAESKALKEWEKTRKGTRPSTPNLDAIKADSARPKSKKSTATGGGGGPRRSDRGQKGAEAKKAKGGVQKNPKPMDDKELVAWIKATLKRDPDAYVHDERLYIRWVENRKIPMQRFLDVFDAVQAGKPVPELKAKANGTAKKATSNGNGAKKAPAKKAPAKATAKTAGFKRTPNPLKDARKSQQAARARVRKAAGR